MDKNDDLLKSKDERIAHLEKIIIELTESKQQNAATLAESYRSSPYAKYEKGFKLSSLFSGFKNILIIILLLFVLGFGAISLINSNVFKKSSVFVENVQELSTLATAEAQTKTVLNIKDNKFFGKKIPLPIPGTKREILLIVPATVLAGVDLNEVTEDDMKISEDTKEIDITLPHAKLIQEPSLQMDKITTYVDGGIFNDEVDWNEGFELAASAQQKVKEEVISAGLLTTAEKNADKALTQFFKNMGYKVNITYK
ncbi:MAG: DUF4230 domain-containing protein [Paenisporosarcina sp.]